MSFCSRGMSAGSGRTHVLADEMRVTRVLRIHRHGGVAGNRLRPRRGDRQPRSGLIRDLHLENNREPVLRLHIDFFVGQRGERRGTPVHHALAAIDEALFVEIHEHRCTQREYSGSMVKRSRDQSHDAPSFLSCWMMMPPYFSFHSQTSLDEIFRGRGRRDVFTPFLASARSTTVCVAMPA
jgi:hypothetical protein